jgi:hydroxyacylglutathione hydrolase
MKSFYVKQFVDQSLGNSSYLIASEESGIAAVIDAQRDVEKYIQAASEQGLKLKYALDTHLHADFISGANDLAQHPSLKDTDFQVGVSAKAKAEFKHIPLSEGDALHLDNISIRVLETPGHAPEHISFGIYTKNSETPEILFTGGSLIVGGTGRTDLLGNEQAKPLAHQLYQTIHGKFASLSDEVIVYPTHGAGSFCNTASSGARSTTIGQERLNNLFFQLTNEEEFVQHALTGLSNYPTYYQHLREVNRKGVNALGAQASLKLKPLSPEEVKKQLESGAVVLDVRSTSQFLAGHIEGSYGIPLATPLITWAGWVIPFGSPIILIADTPAQISEAVQQLLRIGYDEIRGYLESDVSAWQKNNLPVVSTKSINAEELHTWLLQTDVPAVLDVRFNKEWQAGHIRGAKHVEAGILPEVARSLIQSDTPLVVHCQRGNRSTIAISILEQKGFKNLYALEGGLNMWVEADFEITDGVEDVELFRAV